MSFPELPPRRTLPPDVRERMRRKVFGRRTTARTPLTAAAGVALLVAAGVVGVVVGQGASTDSDTMTSNTTTPPAAILTQRGFAAPDEVRQIDTTAEDTAACGFDRALFTARLPGRRVLAAPGDRFCELTYSMVSVATAPDTTVGDDARLLWRSPTDVLVGRVPPNTVRLQVVQPEHNLPQAGALVGDRYFVTMATTTGLIAVILSFSGARPDASHSFNALDVPVRANTADRFPGGKSDAREGQTVLARCLDWAMRNSTARIEDTAHWQLGASTGVDTVAGLAVLRGPAGATAYCLMSEFRPTEVRPPMPVEDTGNAFTVLDTSLTRTDALRGIVARLGGVVRDDVWRMDLVDTRGDARSVEVQQGTFAAWVANVPSLDMATLAGVRLRAYGKDDALLYEAPAV
ncbi:hypothetical protein ACQPZF_29955 [Actinosynnema sp. CS-041913]|uniref:hypothetical protein n=1 Tax=Actinosynnema sp. CS-041913 TaxID=3239917 RepID=UPI003D8E4F31